MSADDLLKGDSSELLTRAATRPQAFVALFDRHNREIHAYLARRAGPPAAEDLLSEVWLRAFAARGTYDASRGAALPWLYGIARNTLRSHWRSQPLGSVASDDRALDPWPDVDDDLDARRLGGALADALASLDPTDREVVLLATWEELTPTEIASVLGIPAGTARWRLHRARKVLQATPVLSPKVEEEMKR